MREWRSDANEWKGAQGKKSWSDLFLPPADDTKMRRRGRKATTYLRIDGDDWADDAFVVVEMRPAHMMHELRGARQATTEDAALRADRAAVAETKRDFNLGAEELGVGPRRRAARAIDVAPAAANEVQQRVEHRVVPGARRRAEAEALRVLRVRNAREGERGGKGKAVY